MIEFHLDARSGVAPYMQLIHQVRHALRLDLLREGDRLPTVKDVAAGLAINPNTVLKAYRELEYQGLVAARPGVGTFVTGLACVTSWKLWKKTALGAKPAPVMDWVTGPAVVVFVKFPAFTLTPESASE